MDVAKVDVVKADIEGEADVEVLIRDFYGRCFADDLLGQIFVDVAQLDLEAHLPTMVDFWMTVLFRAGRPHGNGTAPHAARPRYRGNVLSVHVDLNDKSPLTPAHLDRWLELWSATVAERFAGPKAQLALTQAQRFAWSLNRRLAGESGSELTTIRRADLVIPL